MRLLFVLFLCSLLLLFVQCNKQTHCYAYSQKKEVQIKETNPFSIRSGKENNNNKFTLADPFSSKSKREKKTATPKIKQSRFLNYVSILLPKKKEKSPFEVTQKKKKKQKHHEGLFRDKTIKQ